MLQMNINKNKILLLAIITINSMLFPSTNAIENNEPKCDKPTSQVIPHASTAIPKTLDGEQKDLNSWYVNVWNRIKTTEEKNPKAFWISTSVISIAIITALYKYFNNVNEVDVDPDEEDLDEKN